MSVAQTANIAREIGNDVNVDFDFAFKIFVQTDIEVSKILNSTGVATLLTLGVDYSVDFDSAAEEGTVTYTVAPTALQDSFIKRVLPQDQQSKLPIEGGMPETTVENMIDKNTLLVQDMQEQVGRSITFAETSEVTGVVIPDPEANTFLGWNAAGDDLENKTLSDVGTLEKASQADAEAGTDNDDYMTPLRAFQSITSFLTAPTAIGEDTPAAGDFTIITSTGDIFTVAWADYSGTSTIIGWAAAPSVSLFTKRVGNIVFVAFEILGTSNSTETTFTVPHTAATGMNVSGKPAIVKDNNVVMLEGNLVINAGSSLVTIFKDVDGTDFVTSGTKWAVGQFWYEAE